MKLTSNSSFYISCTEIYPLETHEFIGYTHSSRHKAVATSCSLFEALSDLPRWLCGGKSKAKAKQRPHTNCTAAGPATWRAPSFELLSRALAL